MQVNLTDKLPFTLKSDLLAIGYSNEKSAKNVLFKNVDQKLNSLLSRIVRKEGFKGGVGENKLLNTAGKLPVNYVLIVGLGSKDKCELGTVRTAGAAIQSAAKQIRARGVVSEILAADFGKFKPEDCAQALLEGFALSQYKFEHYLKRSKNTFREFVAYHPSQSHAAKIRKALNKALVLSEGVLLARDLVNTPASDMTPAALAQAAKKISGVATRVHNLAAVKKMQMGAFLSVAQGSTANPPCFIEMHYRPAGKVKKHVALVGKGVTFDSGGYSIKPAKAMETMKSDMAGAAAVIGLMSILSRLKPGVAVSGYVAATENMVDGFAQRPGDVCRAMNGKTIEVINTDAEGRLTLADSLTYAVRKKPDCVIDMATLTGACIVALGFLYSGVMGNDQNLIEHLVSHGKHCGENLWQLPLPEDYKDDLKSQIADMKNCGSPYAGSITAGIFLKEFVGNTKWAHIDIAGPSWTDKPLPYTPVGGTGVMVRTLARFLEEF